MGAWWWEVCWGLWLAMGWAVLGTAVSLAAWHLGLLLRQKTLRQSSLSLSLCRLGVAFYSACVLLTPSGPARLRCLRALVAWLHHPTFWNSRNIHYAGMPDALPDALAVCVLEVGPEAAPLLDAVWDVYQSTRLTAAGRERLFSEAFVGRLRAFFLASEDPASQRAALRLHGLLSCELLEAKWAAELPEALLPQLVRSGPGAPPVERHQLHLLRSQAARNQAFLRHPDFVASLRGRLRGGDPGGLLLPARFIYYQDASEVQLGPLYGPGCYTSSGSTFLFRPVLRDLLLNYDRLSKVAARRFRRPFRLCPTLRPEEAVAVMEGCVVPLLRRAEELPPAGLRCLLQLFPTHMDYRCHSAQTPQLDPDVAAAGVALGSRLRGLHVAAVQSALASGRLNDAQHWALVGGLCGEFGASHGFLDCPELCRLLLRDTLRLPLTRKSRKDALSALYGMIRLGELWASLAWGGGFVVLRRLIDLHQPPYKTIEGLGFDNYGSQLSVCLLDRAGNLFQPHVPGVVIGAPPTLEPAEVTGRLVAWREAGLSAALRRLVDRQPPPGTSDIRGEARDLLQLHDDLLLHHPIHTHSRLPHEIYFPDY